MTVLFLNEILIVLGLSVLVLFVCHRVRIPTIVGFLLTGILAGPHGLGLVRAVEVIETLAEVGVVLLLFAIGLEFSLKGLLQIRRLAFWGGALQVGLTCAVTALMARTLGRSAAEAVFLGFLISLSSTAIVLKVLQERAEVETPQGHASVGILIFQDLMVVPMMLFTPLLAGASESWGLGLLVFLLEGLGIILLVKIGSQWVVPWILFKVTQTRIRELFLLSVVLLCFAVAWVTHLAGLSLSLGAFLAGLIISESEYSHQVIGNIIPFRDVFASFFFISVGMLLDIRFLGQQPGLIFLLALGVLVLKTAAAGLTSAIIGLSARTVILVGMILSQVGEFSFILSKTGLQYGLLSSDMYQVFLEISVITMIATPFIIMVAPAAAEAFLRLPLPPYFKKGSYPIPGAKKVQEKNHLIIVGFGINGRNIARAAKVSGIPYVIIEMNSEIVREARVHKEPIDYGDGTQEAVLEHAQIHSARVIVIAINDPAATRRITEMARRLNPKIHIIVRTRFLKEMRSLYELGANEVIPEEFETSVEIFSRVLSKYLHPKEEIERFVNEIRSEGYEMFRSLSKEAHSCLDITHCLPEVEMTALRLTPGSSMAGRTLAETGMRKKFNVNLLAIRRGTELIYNPDPNEELRNNDLLVVLGQPDDIAELASHFHIPEGGS